MASLLSRLHIDYFVLDLAQSVITLPTLNGFTLKSLGEKIIEVGVPKERGLNDLFAQLSAANIHVTSMKNKSNRLEQLFIDLIDSKNTRENL